MMDIRRCPRNTYLHAIHPTHPAPGGDCTQGALRGRNIDDPLILKNGKKSAHFSRTPDFPTPPRLRTATGLENRKPHDQSGVADAHLPSAHQGADLERSAPNDASRHKDSALRQRALEYASEFGPHHFADMAGLVEQSLSRQS